MTTVVDSFNNSPFRRNFLRFRFKTKGNSPKQSYTSPVIPSTTTTTTTTTPANNASANNPRQAYNPAIHPLLAKPVAREENFVLLPHRNVSSKRKRDPNSPVGVNIKPKGREHGISEWTHYLSSYAEVKLHTC